MIIQPRGYMVDLDGKCQLAIERVGNADTFRFGLAFL